ncbi:MAG TPA: HAD family hydrolase [Longimicrobiales bacterium]
MPGKTTPDGLRLVLVDFDDTLVDTAPRFQNARRALFELMEAEGFDPDDARRVHHDEVDREMLDLHGLGPFRLEPSFRETYLRLCALDGRVPDPAVIQRCVALAREVIGPPPCYDGAIEALARLAATHDTAIYTQAGNPEYQFDCIRASGVLDIIPPHRVRICARKTTAEFRATLAHFGVGDPATACMVGNSIRSDINPALAAGARAILVEVDDPWVFDLVEPVSDDFVRVRRFPEAVDWLLGRPGNGGGGGGADARGKA